MWIVYSLLGAFFQASEMAIKKKALKTKGTNNIIAFLILLSAGIMMGMFLLFQNENIPINDLSFKFWIGLFSSALINVIATYFLYKALDISELSYLMPFMTLTSLAVIFPPMFLFGEYPSFLGMIGILIVVLGALIMGYKKLEKTETEVLQNNQNRKGLIFFFIYSCLLYRKSPGHEVSGD